MPRKPKSEAVPPIADDAIPPDILERFKEAKDESRHIITLDLRIEEMKEQLNGLKKLREEHVQRLITVSAAERQTTIPFGVSFEEND
jgi:hypothetical protein